MCVLLLVIIVKGVILELVFDVVGIYINFVFLGLVIL